MDFLAVFFIFITFLVEVLNAFYSLYQTIKTLVVNMLAKKDGDIKERRKTSYRISTLTKALNKA
jgi:hypothetical protein